MISLNDVLLAASNIPVDDPIAEIWGQGLQGGYRIIEYTGSLPITINANGDALLDYRIYGAAWGVGDRTENFCPQLILGTYESTGYETTFANIACTTRPILLGEGSITVSVSIGSIYLKKVENGVLVRTIDAGRASPATIIIPSFGTYAIQINARMTDKTLREINRTIVAVQGSTAPTSYIPYGYKLPMTVSDGNTMQTVPVYIGENQLDSVEGVADYVDKASGKIVRMIGEYTFTGDESFNKYGNSDVFYTSTTIDPVGITTVNTITMRCNHPAFTAIENKDTRYWLNPEADDICCFLPGGRSQVFFRSTSNFTTAAECEAYLKAQYDNGTPVKISYWLKTPIEEAPPVPLPEIPTIDGTTVIDYDGDPKPSQMYVKYKGKSGGA